MHKPLLPNQPVSAAAAMAARVAICSSVLFVALLVALHFLEPEFDPTWRFVSEYQLGAYGWIMHLAFGALAISLAATGMALWRQARGWLGRMGNVILWIAALGILMAGIWTTDPIQTTKDAVTSSGAMHVFGASLDYTPVAMILLSFILIRTKDWLQIRTPLLITAGISLALMFVFIGALPKDGVFGPGVYAGLAGRLLLVSYLGWIVTVGMRVLKIHWAEKRVK
jgi:hypothetical protein